nr:DUF4833 domain-containing protein [uncultured Flavobacterium sp.]
MKNLFITFFIICNLNLVYGQNNYPKPPLSHLRLFYIQHSNNHNTYVYDAKMIGKNFDKKNPVEQYRIVYTDGGVKKTLTEIQKKMAYGLNITHNAVDQFEMFLVVSKDVKLHLILDSNGKPKVWTIVDNKKMFLDRIFIQIKEGSKGLKPDVSYVVFEGSDYSTGKPTKATKKIS